MREMTKVLTIDGKDYRITQFDALSGGKVFLFCVKKLVPLIGALDVNVNELFSVAKVETEKGKDGGDDGEVKVQGLQSVVNVIMPMLEAITPEDLQEFMQLCLAQVEIKLPAGYEKVIRNGELTECDVKYSTKLALQLCFAAIEGILEDFFGEGSLDFLKGLTNMKQ